MFQDDLNVLYPLMEDFYTIQGEGFYSGNAAYFVRLAGCNVGCVWCDVKESWDENAHTKVMVQEILNKITSSKAKIVVITGGEPMMHDLKPLTNVLRAHKIQTNLETSGIYPISGDWDWICFSPKKFLKSHDSVPQYANELKVIVYNKSDIEFAEMYENLVLSNCKLYLQPEWESKEKVLPIIIDYVKTNPKWKISLQTHKYLNIP